MVARRKCKQLALEVTFLRYINSLFMKQVRKLEARRETVTHLIWFDLVLLDFTWCYLISFGLTWFHLISLDCEWCYLISLAFILFHLISRLISHQGKGKDPKNEKGKREGPQKQKGKGESVKTPFLTLISLGLGTARTHARTTQNDFPVGLSPPTSDTHKHAHTHTHTCTHIHALNCLHPVVHNAWAQAGGLGMRSSH